MSGGVDDAATAEMTARLNEIDVAIARDDFRAANIRAGYVYVISNTGALGPNIVKIGLARRLEPMDRVRELGLDRFGSPCAGRHSYGRERSTRR
jgi:hypothetical protein